MTLHGRYIFGSMVPDCQWSTNETLKSRDKKESKMKTDQRNVINKKENLVKNQKKSPAHGASFLLLSINIYN